MNLLHYLRASAVLIAATTISAHMQLNFPPPFNASNNPHRLTPADPYLQYPYDCCGPAARWEHPCRGYLDLLDTPEGSPTATWEAGSVQSWGMSGIGNHYGGSCQVGFSIDRGETFRVATSYEGDCPHRNGGNEASGQTFSFTVPRMSPGVHVFAWVWYNREQELNMNCAAVEITQAGNDYANPNLHSRIALADRPVMLVADARDECTTPKQTAELKYPSPGPEVVYGDGEYPLMLPTGNCGGKA